MRRRRIGAWTMAGLAGLVVGAVGPAPMSWAGESRRDDRSTTPLTRLAAQAALSPLWWARVPSGPASISGLRGVFAATSNDASRDPADQADQAARKAADAGHRQAVAEIEQPPSPGNLARLRALLADGLHRGDDLAAVADAVGKLDAALARAKAAARPGDPPPPVPREELAALRKAVDAARAAGEDVDLLVAEAVAVQARLLVDLDVVRDPHGARLNPTIYDRFGARFSVLSPHVRPVLDWSGALRIGDRAVDYLAAWDLRDEVGGIHLIPASIEWLSLDDTAVTDAALAVMVRKRHGTPDIRGLSLRNTAVTDAGLRHIERLAHLAIVDLGSPAITALGSDGVQVTEAGVRRLRDRTKARVLWSPRRITLTAEQESRARALAATGQIRFADDGSVSLLRIRPGARVSAEDWTRIAAAPPAELGIPDRRTMPADLGLVGRMEGLRVLRLAGVDVRDDELVRLGGLQRLEMLDLSHTKVTDAGLPHLARLRSLRELDLTGCPVHLVALRKLKAALPALRIHFDAGVAIGLPDEDTVKLDGALEVVGLPFQPERGDAAKSAAAIAMYPKLRSLRHVQTPGDEGGQIWRAVVTLRDLRSLDISVTKIPADVSLESLGELRVLSAWGCGFDDARLRQVAKLTKLERLKISENDFGDRGLAELTALPALRELDIGHTEVTEASIPALSRMKTLRKLTLPNRFGAVAVAELKRGLPDCEID